MKTLLIISVCLTLLRIAYNLDQKYPHHED